MIIARIPISKNNRVYLSLIKYELKKNIKKYKKSLKNILDLYPEKQIEDIIDNSIIMHNNYIFCQTDGLSGKVLRSLEYGTYNNKSLKLITLSVNKILKEVNLYEPNFKF